MSYLVDTNVLLRSVQPAHTMHNDAAHALRALLAQDETLCLVPKNIIEFWAVATRPVANNGLGLPINQAIQEVTRIKRAFNVLDDVPAIFPEWERLVAQHRVAGKATHDARLVAAMHLHGLSHIQHS
jgi:predicted nucleic acid-binding protein